MKFTNVLLFVAITIFIGGCDGQPNVDKQSNTTKEMAVEHASKHLEPKYVCAMHPQIIRHQPASCPLYGMDLVKKEAEEQTTERKVL